MFREIAVASLDERLRPSPKHGSFLAASRYACCRRGKNINLASVTDDAPELYQFKRPQPCLLVELARCAIGGRLTWLKMPSWEGDSSLPVSLQDGQKTAPAVGHENASDLLHVRDNL